MRSKVLFQGALCLFACAQAGPVGAAELSPTKFLPAWTWSGFYLGGNIGAATGTSRFSDPLGPSIFGDNVTTAGFLAGLQLGYNWTVAPRWVLGGEADASYIDSNGTFTCMQAANTVIGSNCEARPRALVAFTGRLGFVPDEQGRSLFYGKAGAAWTHTDISITPNNHSAPDLPEPLISPGEPTSAGTGAWGWTVGAGIEHALTPAWSLNLEYDYYRFAAADVPTPDTIKVTREVNPTFTAIPGSTAGVKQDLHVVKLGLNYHWGNDLSATWADAPATNIPAMPVKAHPVPVATGWDFDAGVRYWYSIGRSKNTSGSGSLTSQLTYDNMTGHSGEVFGRLDTPSEVFVQGFFGGGGITNGSFTDEDWFLSETAPAKAPTDVEGRLPTAFEVTPSSIDGSLEYATADVGYNVLRNRDYRIGPFVGYSYFHEKMNAMGCTQLVTPGSVCSPPEFNPLVIITQSNTWQSLRVGISAETRVWDRFWIGGDVAYLPYARFHGLDTHLARVPVAFFPQDGTGRGIQAEIRLSYRVTEKLTVGVGGRYWAMWSTSASQSCNGGCGESGVFEISPPDPFTTNSERYGAFVDLHYQLLPW